MKQPNNDQQQQLLEAVSQLYDSDLAALEHKVEHELDLIRQQAMARVESEPQPTPANSPTLLHSFQQTLRDFYTPTMVGGGFAALLALFIYTDMGVNNPNQGSDAVASNSDDIFLYELVLDDKPIDFYQQLAFVEWLDEEGQLLLADS